MNPVVRDKLCRMVARFGPAVIHDPRRCAALLNDFCPHDRREVHVLQSALRAGVPAELAAGARPGPLAAIGRLTKRLEADLSLAAGPARWAVESWALALGVVTPQQITAVRPQPASPKQPAAKQAAANQRVVPPPVVVSPKAPAAPRLRRPVRGWLVALALALLVFAPGAGVGLARSAAAKRETHSQRTRTPAASPATTAVVTPRDFRESPPASADEPITVALATEMPARPATVASPPIDQEEERWVREVLTQSTALGRVGRETER